VKSSITSRPKFSLRCLAVLVTPSSQTSIAGSFDTARRRSAKLPVACWRIVRCCRHIRYGTLTFCTLVAKWSCQNQTRRSSTRRGLARIWSNHHAMGGAMPATLRAVW
jgi:hypothetical protein